MAVLMVEQTRKLEVSLMSNTKRLPLFIWRGIRKGPMVSLVERVLIAVVYSLVIIAVISAVLGSWVPFVATPLPILASYLFWRQQYKTSRNERG